MRLKISLKSDLKRAGCNNYHNEINSENYKEIAIVLQDLANYGLPMEKAIRYFLTAKGTDWDYAIGAS